MQTQTDDSQPVQDAMIVEETPAELLGNLESSIKEHIASIDTAKTELKKLKEMLSDMFANDSTYQEHDKTVKEAVKIRTKTKLELLKQPAAAQLNTKIKDMSSDLKDLQNALSDYLREYQRLSGSNEIEGDDGEVREIVYVARLVKRSSHFK
jgi:predicted RNase H-like nuclease (RuvC/YqgF family)